MTLGRGAPWCYVHPMAWDPMDLTGVWLSVYEYESDGRGPQTSTHKVAAVHDGARLRVRSVSGSGSELSMDLEVDGRAVTGTWSERTSQDGYYQGFRFHGAVQMILSPSKRVLEGTWVGFSRDMSAVNTGTWKLVPAEGPP